jgi:hypothetical protein
MGARMSSSSHSTCSEGCILPVVPEWISAWDVQSVQRGQQLGVGRYVSSVGSRRDSRCGA